MAHNVRLKATIQNANIANLIGAIPSGFLRFYDGTQPVSVDTALSGNTLGASLPLSSPSAPAASSGSTTFNAITSAVATATITSTWGSLVDSGGTRQCDFTVGTSGADVNISGTTTIQNGSTVSCSSLVASQV